MPHCTYLLLCIVALCLNAVPLSAQPGHTPLIADNIKTLRMTVDGDADRIPIIALDGSETLEVSFDDLTHEYHRYTYRITHCDYAGAPTTALFESDYVSAVADNEVIDDYQPSLNTTVAYNHYRFTLPNAHVRPLLCGNYRLTVYTEDEEGEPVPVIETYFGVVDRKVAISLSVSGDTEIDRYAAHQQLTMRIDCGSLVLRDAANEVKALVMQNRRTDRMVMAPEPTSQSAGLLRWDHDRDLIFPAGNEYRKMEMRSTRYPGMHTASMRWDDPYYRCQVTPDEPRRNYLYDEDRDGLSLVACDESSDPDTEADYVMTRFTLVSPPLADHRVYVNGRWTIGGLVKPYEMTYHAEAGAYVADVLLKLGYYNYQYLAVTSTDARQLIGETGLIEGDYHQTENEYDVIAYYRPTGARYWQLVGYVTPRFRMQQ